MGKFPTTFAVQYMPAGKSKAKTVKKSQKGDGRIDLYPYMDHPPPINPIDFPWNARTYGEGFLSNIGSKLAKTVANSAKKHTKALAAKTIRHVKKSGTKLAKKAVKTGVRKAKKITKKQVENLTKTLLNKPGTKALVKKESAALVKQMLGVPTTSTKTSIKESMDQSGISRSAVKDTDKTLDVIKELERQLYSGQNF